MQKKISENKIKKVAGVISMMSVVALFLLTFSLVPQITQGEEKYPDCAPSMYYSPEKKQCVMPVGYNTCIIPKFLDPTSKQCVTLAEFCVMYPLHTSCNKIQGGHILEGGSGTETITLQNYLYVETLEATEVKENTVVLNGRGGPDLSLNPKLETTGYFRYSKKPISPIYCNDIYGTSMLATEDISLGSSGAPKIFSQAISNLTPDTMYYYCAIVSNKKDIAYGGEGIVKSFKTRPLQTTVKTLAPSQVTETSALIKGTYNAVKEIKKTYFKYREVVNEDNLESSDGEWQTLLVKDYSASTTGSIGRTYDNISFLLEKLKPSTRYVYTAWVDDKDESVSGLPIYFTTKTAITIDEDYYCKMNPLDVQCIPNLIIAPESISYNSLSVNKPVYMSVSVKNTGGGDVKTPAQHIFQYSRDPYTEEIIKQSSSTTNTIRKNGGDQKTYTNITFPEEGLYLVRACADTSINGPSEDGSTGTVAETNEKDNCGGGTINPGAWTVINVNSPLCNPPKFYDQESGSCVNPAECDPETELYIYQTNSCVPKKVCDENETYNRYKDSCIIIQPEYCALNPNDSICLPGPGDYYNDDNGEWDDYSSSLGGTWTSGGWVNGSWIGGTYKTSSGRTWTGGIWKNGYWSGGKWSGVEYGNATVGQTATPPWDAIVRYHEGVEHVFVRQIMKNTALQAMYGYTADKDLSTFSWDLADLFAKMLGYIGDDGKEIRVSYPDIAAYELRLVDGRLMVYEYYDYKIVSIQNLSTAIKSKADYEYYFNKR